ncbi:MAG: tRNA guanosine(34) transglycosylase Tgt [Candidatus Paceibacterota bacterium]
MFEIKKRHKKARLGILTTPHGKIQTPNLAFVATHGNIRILDKKEQKTAGPDLIIANTFHLWVNKKVGEIKKAGGIHKWNGLKIPTMTDSGGFQVFSLGWGKTHNIGKVKSKISNIKTDGKSQVKINNNGVVFEYDGKKYELTPEKSIKLQRDIGADIIFVFDECTSPLHDFAYNKKSLKRTHRWAKQSLSAHKRFMIHDSRYKQQLFGIVQGGVYEKLRKESSKFVGALDFDGFGIGGSFGEKQMGMVLEWALSGLPEEKPRHLLGIGKIKDIFIAVEKGIDLFDCAIPTREARHGAIYTKDGKINYRKKGMKFHNIYKKDKIKAMKLATIHNIKFYKELFSEIRKTIRKGKNLSALKKEYKGCII